MKNNLNSSHVFWDSAHTFVYQHLIRIRQVSQNTVSAYRDGLNHFIDYLEVHKTIGRKSICYADFSRSNLEAYLDWMLNTKKLSAKTCNLRMTAIRALLEYASTELKNEIMAVYVGACDIKSVRISERPIEFFETAQLKALLNAADTRNKTGRRNQMMLILYYDTAARISELLELTVGNVHIRSETPYVTLHGKGGKYRNIPLMGKTVEHLKRYLREFHPDSIIENPMFYTVTHGTKHNLSADTVENMLKKCAETCRQKGQEMPSMCHCHMLRKTRAMDLYQSGVPLAHIQQLLGHKDLSTTSGFYAFATLDTLAKSMAKTDGDRNSEEIKKWEDKVIFSKLYRL